MSKMARQSFSVSDFYCVRCGGKGMPLPRKDAKRREEGHLKKMYCIHCKMETNHREIRAFDYSYTHEDLMEDIAAGVYKGRECEEPILASLTN